MKIEIPISRDSEQYITKIFAQYEQVYKPIKHIKEKCVLHLYPKEDTMIKGKDNITGYIDSMLFELYVFDVAERKVYKHKFCDAINVNGVLSQQVKIFKDLSTMIVIEEPVKINYYKAVEVEAPDYINKLFKEYE